MRSALFLVLAAALFPLPLPAQQAPPQKKSPKVYTEDDLQGLSGGISVVGEAPKPEKPKTKGKKEKAGEPAGEAAAPAASKVKIPNKSEQCADWAWAVAVASSLGAEGVPFDAAYWVDKSFGGTRCPARLAGVAALAASVDGDYTLDDGTKLHITSAVGVPGAAGMVDRSDKNRPTIVVWQGIPYLTAGVSGVKEVFSDGTVLYHIKKMTLSNPYLEKTVTFDSDKDKESELEAVAFTVTGRQ